MAEARQIAGRNDATHLSGRAGPPFGQVRYRIKRLRRHASTVAGSGAGSGSAMGAGAGGVVSAFGNGP